MHQRIEDYLAEVSDHLAVLPTARRTEELREMRQHLENAIIVNKELGQSEVEAVERAIEQFGKPQLLAENITQVWQRGRTRDKRYVFGAVLCTYALMCFLPQFLNPLEKHHILELFQSAQPQAVVELLLWQLPPVILTGAISGFAFPKKAVLVTGLAVGTYEFFSIAKGAFAAFLICKHNLLLHPAHSGMSQSLGIFFREGRQLNGLYQEHFAHFLIGLLTAWVASRWRSGKMRQRNIAATSCQVSTRG